MIIPLYWIQFATVISDILSTALAIIFDQYIAVGLVAVHLVLKIVIIMIFWKLFSIKLGNSQLKFTKSLIQFISVNVVQLMIIFIRIIVYLLDQSAAIIIILKILAWVDMLFTLVVDPFIFYVFMLNIRNMAVKKVVQKMD